MTSNRAAILMVAATLIAAGCKDKGKKDKTTSDKAMAGGGGSAVIEYRPMGACEKGGGTIVESDLDKNGKNDVISVFAAGSVDVLVCKETDLNFDGRMDLLQVLSEDGTPLRYEIDLDFDGKVDVLKYFASGVTTRSEFDTNFDGKMDTFNTYEGGKLVRSDRDRNGDGDLDESQVFDDEGALACLGYDTDGDSTMDHWEMAATGEVIENPSPGNPCEESGTEATVPAGDEG